MPRGQHYLDGNFGRGKGYTYLSAEEFKCTGHLNETQDKTEHSLSPVVPLRPTKFYSRVAGIGILIVVLGALLILGCWYYKRRSGYKSLLTKSFRGATMKTSEGKSTLLGSRFPLQEYTTNFNHVVPDAPPAYDKISASPLPPPYAP